MDNYQFSNPEQNSRSLQLTNRGQNQTESIDLLELMMTLLNHWWQILLAAVLCGALTFGYTYYRIIPMYRATSKIFIASSSSASALLTSSDLSWGNNTKGDYSQLLKSRALLEQVAENLGSSRSASQLAGMISIGTQTDTHILTISVTSPYPTEAADIANELAKQCRTFLPEVMKLEAPSFYESALVPANKISPSYTRNTMMGALVGVVLCGGFYVLLFLLNDSITNPDDVLKYVGMQPLATIPEVETVASKNGHKKGKKKDNIEIETDGGESGEMLEALLTQKIHENEQQKGGASK